MNWPVVPSLRRAVRGRGTPCRRFTLLDAMILVGGAAVGFAGCRADEARSRMWWYDQVQLYIGFFLLLASWLILILRLRRPRPTIRLLARQPGAVACFAVVVTQLVQHIDSLLISLAISEIDYFNGVGSAIWDLLSDFGHTSAVVVPISWILLVANRRWRPEPGWIDRSGRILGWIWIGWMVTWPLLYLIVERYDLNRQIRSIM